MTVQDVLIAAARGEVARGDVEPYLPAAAAEGMTGLLARAAERVPHALRVQALALQARAAQTVAETARIATAFAEAGIPLLVFKGAVLAQQLYGDSGLRAFSDVDLLVAPDRAAEGERLLVRLGYAETQPLTEGQRKTNRKYAGQSLFDGPMLVDFHSRLSNAQFPLRIPFADLWQRRQSVTIDGHTFQTLGETDLAVVTCSHAAKHLWHRLELLAQIAALARRAMDWPAVERLAVAAGAARQVGLSFALAAELLGIEAPPLPACYAAAAPALVRAREIVAANLFAAAERRVDAVGRDHFLLADRSRDAWRSLALAALIPTPADWRRSRLPEPLQRVVRPLRLLGKRLRRR